MLKETFLFHSFSDSKLLIYPKPHFIRKIRYREKFHHFFFPSFNIYLLNTITGAVLGAGDMTINETSLNVSEKERHID